MLEQIAPLLTAVRNAGSPLIAAIFVATLTLLFLPDSVIEQLGLVEFRKSYKMYLGIAVLASGSLVAVTAVFASAPFIRKIWEWHTTHRKVFKALKSLTKDEKAFLRPYIVDDENTQYASIYDGVANGLLAKNIVYRASHITVPGMPGMECPFNLRSYCRKVLNRRRHWLD